MVIEVYGASDDTIQIDGDIEEEFYAIDADERSYYLGFSDGTILQIRFYEGVWRITPKYHGEAQLTINQSLGTEEDYSDQAVLSGVVIKWVVCGADAALNKHV